MNKKAGTAFYLMVVMLLISCTTSDEKNSEVEKGWMPMNRVAKTIDNITYIFPADVGVELRDSAIQITNQSILENLQLIKEKEFTDTIKFEFFHTRKEMKLTTGHGVKGLAMPHQNSMYSLLDLSETSPIQHELMHMIAMLNWQRPYSSMQWFNEGLATYAGKICGKNNFAEVYYYMLTHNLLFPIDSLINDFYSQNEVIAYTQSAYIVKYLSEKYGWAKVKAL